MYQHVTIHHEAQYVYPKLVQCWLSVSCLLGMYTRRVYGMNYTYYIRREARMDRTSSRQQVLTTSGVASLAGEDGVEEYLYHGHLDKHPEIKI